jgi:hypothetical protein
MIPFDGSLASSVFWCGVVLFLAYGFGGWTGLLVYALGMVAVVVGSYAIHTIINKLLEGR